MCLVAMLGCTDTRRKTVSVPHPSGKPQSSVTLHTHVFRQHYGGDGGIVAHYRLKNMESEERTVALEWSCGEAWYGASFVRIPAHQARDVYVIANVDRDKMTMLLASGNPENTGVEPRPVVDASATREQLGVGESARIRFERPTQRTPLILQSQPLPAMRMRAEPDRGWRAELAVCLVEEQSGVGYEEEGG
jgi:hypothetical protein